MAKDINEKLKEKNDSFQEKENLLITENQVTMNKLLIFQFLFNNCLIFQQYLAKISSLEESIGKEKNNLAEIKLQMDVLQVVVNYCCICLYYCF